MISINDSEEILKKEYNIDNFVYLTKEILLPDFENDIHPVDFNKAVFSQVTCLGESKPCDLTVFEVILKQDVQNQRVTITQEMFRILKGLCVNNAVVAFASADGRNYRISLLTSKYEYDGNKIVKVVSNPRRYSYSLGFGTKTKTAYKFLIAKGKVANLDELIARFSVEVVNKQFYSEVAAGFTQLVGGKRDGKEYKKLLNLYSVVDQNKYAEFAVRLIGRIMFCWFLKEKKSEKGISLIPEDMLLLSNDCESNNYYHDVLEPLFFELLNTNQNRRRDKFGKEEIYKKIPYLNGGLFSPHADDLYKYSSSSQSGAYGVVTIPNAWFKTFYEVLGQYNFTVDENTSYDIELSIDPEMLGRIFENLLAEINPETGENAKKSTGSFYTPRDIVDYMVDSSLFEYLKEKTELSEPRLKALITYGREDDTLAILDINEKKKIINAVFSMTVLDPACGSGAFPIGMLQKIVYILQEIDPDATLWFNKATENVGKFIKKEFKKKLDAGSLNYIRKLSVIQNSIFGIDIQPIAVEIARLRCFLSLVIEEKVNDEEYNRGINPLPNLDFKFIIANSLMELDNETQISLFENQAHIEELKAVREEYFNADSERRTELKLEFADIQKKMYQETISNYAKIASTKYQQLSDWSPFKNEATSWFDPEWMFGIKDGFDIVIGNPPYVQIKQIDWDSRKYFEKHYNSAMGRFNLFYLFVEKASYLCKDKGNSSFIIPDRIMLNTQCEGLRDWLLNRQKINEIISFDESVFQDAVVDSIILSYQNSKEKEYMIKCCDRIKVKEICDKKREMINKSYFEKSINKQFSLTFDNKVETILKKIAEKSIKLGAISDVKDGIIQSKIPDLLFLNEKKDDYSKKMLVGRNINKYEINYANKWVNYNQELMREEEIKRLNNPKNIGLRLRVPEIFERNKILTRQTADEIIAAFDDENFYYANTLHGTTITDIRYDVKYVLSILNCKLTTWYYRKTTAEGGKVFAQIKIAILNQLPILDIDKVIQNQFIIITNQIMANKKAEIDTNNLETEIDKLVYELYGLTEEEIAIVEGKNE